MEYKYCGKSGLQLPLISLGLWHNFGGNDNFETATAMIKYAFDNGITHFDLANNYGPPAGSAESNFGKILAKELKGHRDELVVSSKAGHLMWNGPYGDGGSRKSIMASIDQSLKRTGLEYFDIFYSHRYDPKTPIEETMQALVDIVKQGKALYIGLSKYPPNETIQAYRILKAQHTPCLIFQDKYSMLVRKPEENHFDINNKNGVGFIAFSPLAQGLLTNKYLNGIPENSRAHNPNGFLKESDITKELISKIKELNNIAAERGQTLAQMALAWILSHPQVTSVITGTSSVSQLQDNLKTLDKKDFVPEELNAIDTILKG